VKAGEAKGAARRGEAFPWEKLGVGADGEEGFN
jgi:hypothetical protein